MNVSRNLEGPLVSIGDMNNEDRARLVLDVTVLWENDVLTVKRVARGAAVAIGEVAGSIAPIPLDGRAGFAFASLDEGHALVHLPDGVVARCSAGGCEVTRTGPAEIELAAGDTATIEAGGFRITAAASRPDDALRAPPVWDRARGGALLHIAAVALIHAWVLAASSRSALASSLDSGDADRAARMKSYLTGTEMRSRASDAPLPDGLGEGEGKQQNDAEGNGRAGGGVRADGPEGSMGKALSRSSEARRWAVPKDVDHDPAPALSRESALEDARSFGMIGILPSGAPTLSATFGEVAAHGLDDLAGNGVMWARAIGESGGAGGLGLVGIGEGGGGDGYGVGVGRIGTLGHTFGEPGSGTGGRGSQAEGGWGSSGWSYGCCGIGGIGGSHRTKAPSVRMGQTQVDGRLPPEAIQRVVRQNFGRFRFCYERGLVDNPSLAGRVTTRFLIGEGGQVRSVAQGGSDLPNASVVACVTEAFKTLSFPAPPDGQTVTVGYPISFSPAK